MEPLSASPPPNLVQLRDMLSEVNDVTSLQICTWLGRKMLRARVSVNTGKYAGSTRGVGWSFPDDSQPFPEYAPHWFHVEGDFDDSKGGGCENDRDENGQIWVAWSRPIGSSWVDPYRTPKKLLRATVARFWKTAR